jgi:hypothetical protein
VMAAFSYLKLQMKKALYNLREARLS